MKAWWVHLARWGFPAVCVVFLATPSISLPGDDLGLRRFRTPPLGPDLRLAQTFTMTGDGLHAIEVFPAGTTERVAGDVRFELYELRNGQPFLGRVVEVLAEDVMRGSSYRFEFAPIGNSKDRDYRFDLVAAPAEGVAFWATKGERYEAGRMHANGRDRWADLAFRTYAPAPSIWGRLMTLRDTHPWRAYLVIAAFAAIWLLLGIVLHLFTSVPPETNHASTARAE